jgi:signal transduction histidine kinase/predicted ATPase
MVKAYSKDAHLARQKIIAELDTSHQLNEHVREMLEIRNHDTCGVLVSGYKGTGKTFFVENFLRTYEKSHPVLIARHYQQHEKVPYFGFKYCISDYLGKIYHQFSKKQFNHFSLSLKHHLGTGFPLLLDYIPELSLITGQATGMSNRSTPAIENQLYPLFKKLFEFLANYSGQPVFFFTDDLQWMDASGINLLKYLLLNLAPRKLVWIGACRPAQNSSRSLSQLDEELGFKNRRIANIVLTGLSAPEARKFLEISLNGNCHEDLVQACYRLSGGNPSHLQLLIDSLKSAGLLKLAEGVWCCDPRAVEARYSGQNAEAMVWENVRRLSEDTREILDIIACMGRFNKRTILDWLEGDSQTMQCLIAEAVLAGILTKGENDVQFCDTHIGELIYSHIEDTRRLELHYKIASLFYSRGLDVLSATEIILMTANFNQAAGLIRAEGKLKIVAELNYKAGLISRQENGLEQARYFFKMSAELLKECPWEDVVEQVSLVYMERARVEYFLGEYELAEIHLDYLLERIPSPLKRAKVFELKVTINNHLGRYRKVVRILKESLSELGLELPVNENQLEQEVKKLTELLSEQESDPSKPNPANNLNIDVRQAILKLLYVGGMGLHHTSDVLMRWAGLQIIVCSGVECISGVKAIGCVSYGRMLIISGEIEKGYEFGLKGLKINVDLNDISLRCRVYGVYAFYIQPWKKPFADSYAFLHEATIAGKEAGDLIGLYILKTHRLNLHLISGLALTDLPQWDFDESYHGRELTYYITHYQKSLLTFLIGESAIFAMPRRQPSWLAAELTIREEKFYRHYVWARYYFLFGHYELAAYAAQQADDNSKLQEGSPLLPANLFTLFLSITQNWSNYDADTHRQLQTRKEGILRSFDLWQRASRENYQAAWYLLNAESARVLGDNAGALSYYEKSAEASGSNLYHFAITHELWGKYLLSRPGEKDDACTHLAEAIRGFNDWGAVAKSRQMLQQYEGVLTAKHSSQKAARQVIDIETIQYELSGDMEVGSLIKKLMVLLLRISGSTQVIVELVKDNGDRILYDALCLLPPPEEMRTREVVAAPASMPVSLNLIGLKSRNTVVVNNVDEEKGFRDMEGLRQRGVQSFLIIPVTINGHLSMVIYLETIFALNWYDAERIRAARITANQGAVIIENARTHERSVELNQELRKEMAEKERLASVIEAQKDAHLRALVQTQDNERKRIASDLHDSLGSLLSTVKLRFNGLQEDFEKKISAKVSRYRDAIRMLDEAIDELRRISHNMLPVSLSRFGLQAALETFVEQINAAQQLSARLQILGLEQRLPEQMEVAVYRICQELVQNTIKHSHATTLSIQMIRHKDSLNIIVEDNGKGMQKKDIARGLGFTTIQSKVSLFKGTFEIECQPGKGTLVIVDLPAAGAHAESIHAAEL